MPTIDDLKIEVEASSGQAEKEIDSLIGTLEKLDKATQSSGLDKLCKRLERISSLSFENLSALNSLSVSQNVFGETQQKIAQVTMPVTNNLPQIPQTISDESMSGAVSGISEITSLVENIPTVTVIDESNLSKATNEIQDVVSGINEIPQVIETKVKIPNAINVEDEINKIIQQIDTLKAERVGIIVNTPGIENTTEKLSRTHRLLGHISNSAKSAGRGILKFGNYFKQLGTSAIDFVSKKLQRFSKMLSRVLFYRAFRISTQGISEGLKNIAKYSRETAATMNNLSTNSLYLQNSLGAALYPTIVALTPALNALTNAIVNALNSINQFVAAWGGASTFIKAKKYMKEYGETAKSTANQIKKYFAGMDEITVIGDNSGSGSSSGTPDYSQMFEQAPISENTQKIIDNLKQNLDNLKVILGGALLVVGAILTFSGANIPLGLGLMVAGATLLGSAVSENWNSLESTMNDKFTAIMLIISGALIVIGAILAFSGVNVPLGIALMIGGALTLATAVAENWKGMPDKVKNIITIIGIAVGTAALVLGSILALSGANIPLGIGLMLVGATTLATSVVLGWNDLPDKVKNTITVIALAVSAAFLVLGACLAFTGANIPIGIALIALGAIGLAVAVAVNWDWVKSKVNTVLSSLLAIISGAGVVLGVLMCLTGTGIPLGIALIIASIKGVKAASDMDDNPVTRFVKNMINGCIKIVEDGVNWIVKTLNKIQFTVPDWVPSIGGKTMGFNLSTVSIPRLKNGGFPDGEDGLFYANHNELVGKFTNGKTAVANNDQIVDGIRSGVYDANQEQNNLLREQNKLLRQLVNKESGGMIDVSTIADAMSRKNRRDGKIVVPVET